MQLLNNIDPSARFRAISFALAGLLSVAGTMVHAEEKDAIVTDRPDFVESSDVVGNGRFQVETGIAVERNKADGRKDRTITTPTLLRIGTGAAWELRLETDGRTVLRTEDLATGASDTVRGYADVSIGVKWHAMDGNGASPSIGVLGHVDVDSGSSAFRGNGMRPSLRVVAEWDLPGEMSLGLMPGLVYDKTGDGKRFAAGIFGAVLGKAWNDRFRTFVEIAAPQIARARNGGTIATLDVGAAYLLSDRWQIDAALYRGLNRNTADLTLAAGLSAKF
jgi:hypothetical protein